METPRQEVPGNLNATSMYGDAHVHYEGLVSSVLPERLWMVPYRRNGFFTGRETLLTALHTSFTKDRTAVLTQGQAINGLGGIGKTQVAVEYAYRHRDAYRFVLWASAATHETFIAAFVSIADGLQLPERTLQEQDKIVAAVSRWLSTHEGWLLIVDNADELEMVWPLLPTGSTGHVLVTTRNQAVGGLESFLVEQMDRAEGTLLLLRRARVLKDGMELERVSLVDWQVAEQIVAEMDGLPLALDQAGAYIEETGCGLLCYLELYQTDSKELLARRGLYASDYPHAVATTWSLSFQKVEQANLAAAELLRLCAFLAPDAIPEELIRNGASHWSPPLQQAGADPFALDQAIIELLKFSLVKRDKETDTLNIHRLVQAVIRDAMPIEEAKLWAERTVRGVNAAFPKVEFEQLTACERCLPHALACADLVEQGDLMFPEAAFLLSNAGRYLHERARRVEAEPLYRRALEIRERQLGAEQPDMTQGHDSLMGSEEQVKPAITKQPPIIPILTADPLAQILDQKRLYRKKIHIPMVFFIVILLLSLMAGEIDGRERLLFPNLSTNPTITPIPDSTCSHIFTVTTARDKGHGSFREMVNKAQDGDCITFEKSIEDNIILTNELDIKHSITILGHRPITNNNQATPTITNGTSNSTNNAIQDDNQATPTITIGTSSSINISIFPNTHVTFMNLSFRGNNTDTFLNNSFIVNNSQDLNIIACSFKYFSSYYNGSVISNLQGNVTLRDSYLGNNLTHSDGGGAIYNLKGRLTLNHSTVTSNYADYSGGGIYNVGGDVFLMNQSNIDHNHSNLQSADAGGGGGITCQGGTIYIVDSTVTSNQTDGDGGGILLIGTSALIISSEINYNRANGKGGGIALETDTGNNQLSNLLMNQTKVNYNKINNKINDFWGKYVQEGQRIMMSDPSNAQSTDDPTQNPQYFLGSLSYDQFSKYCQQYKDNMNQNFTDVRMSTDEKSIECTSSDDSPSRSLPDLYNGASVKDVCALNHPEADGKNVLARVASHWDPSSWQCFKDETLQGSITEDVDHPKLEQYCETLGAHAYLQKRSGKSTGYDWKCMIDSIPQRITMAAACQTIFKNPLAIDRLRDYNDATTWECWGPIPPNQTATTTPISATLATPIAST